MSWIRNSLQRIDAFLKPLLDPIVKRLPRRAAKKEDAFKWGFRLSLISLGILGGTSATIGLLVSKISAGTYIGLVGGTIFGGIFVAYAVGAGVPMMVYLLTRKPALGVDVEQGPSPEDTAKESRAREARFKAVRTLFSTVFSVVGGLSLLSVVAGNKAQVGNYALQNFFIRSRLSSSLLAPVAVVLGSVFGVGRYAHVRMGAVKPVNDEGELSDRAPLLNDSSSSSSQDNTMPLSDDESSRGPSNVGGYFSFPSDSNIQSRAGAGYREFLSALAAVGVGVLAIFPALRLGDRLVSMFLYQLGEKAPAIAGLIDFGTTSVITLFSVSGAYNLFSPPGRQEEVVDDSSTQSSEYGVYMGSEKSSSGASTPESSRRIELFDDDEIMLAKNPLRNLTRPQEDIKEQLQNEIDQPLTARFKWVRIGSGGSKKTIKVSEKVARQVATLRAAIQQAKGDVLTAALNLRFGVGDLAQRRQNLVEANERVLRVLDRFKNLASLLEEEAAGLGSRESSPPHGRSANDRRSYAQRHGVPVYEKHQTGDDAAVTNKESDSHHGNRR